MNSPEISPSVNIWNEGDTGNYWSDYDRTGDTPYAAGENNQDSLTIDYPIRIPHKTFPSDIDDITFLDLGGYTTTYILLAITVIRLQSY